MKPAKKQNNESFVSKVLSLILIRENLAIIIISFLFLIGFAVFV